MGTPLPFNTSLDVGFMFAIDFDFVDGLWLFCLFEIDLWVHLQIREGIRREGLRRDQIILADKAQ
jgi:hypothetical protein